MEPRTSTAAADDAYDIAYLTKYVGKTDTGIAFTDRAYLDGLARSAYSTLVVGNGMAATCPGDGLVHTTSAADYRASRPRLHLVNGMGSFVSHLRTGYLPEHRTGHKVAVMHEEPAAFDFYGTDAWNRAHVRDVLMRAQDGFIFVSNRSRDLWVEEAGLRDVPVYVLPNTSAEETSVVAELAGRDRSEIAAELGLRDEAMHVVVIGTVQRLKAQIDVAEAVRRVRTRRPDVDVHLHIVGRVRDAGYGDELAAFVARHGLEEAVALVGEVPKRRALAYVAAADALVVASRTEAMPLVLLEAMQFGTPVISTRVGGIPEMLDDSSAAFFDVGDVEALGAHLERVHDDHEWAAALARSAQAHYRTDFSNARFLERFDQVLGAIAAASGLAVASEPAPRVDGMSVQRRPEGPLVAVGRPVDERRWRAVLAKEHRERPLRRVEITTPGSDLTRTLELVAPLARLGLTVTRIDAPDGMTVCERDAAEPVLSARQVLKIVGAARHEAAYATHVLTSARRRAKARTLAGAPPVAVAASDPPPESPRASTSQGVRRAWHRLVRRSEATP